MGRTTIMLVLDRHVQDLAAPCHQVSEDGLLREHMSASSHLCDSRDSCRLRQTARHGSGQIMQRPAWKVPPYRQHHQLKWDVYNWCTNDAV